MVGRFFKTILIIVFANAISLGELFLPANDSFSNSHNAYAIQASEYEVKAAYIYHFTQFIQWPESAFDEATSTFNICLMGGNPFGGALSPIFKRHYNGHPFSLIFPADPTVIHKCHILYLDNLPPSRESQIISLIEDKPVLIISSNPGFVEQGGNIGFVSINNSVRFAINRDAGKRRGLTSSAKLLEIAVDVIGNETREKSQ